MRRPGHRRLALALAGVVLFACGSPPPPPEVEVPASTRLEFGLRRDVFFVGGFIPPPNPITGEATPPSLNRMQIVRYRKDTDPPVPARAILLAMPGTFGGAGSFDPLARALLRRSLAGGEPIEVWAIDRRANLLEDLTGADAAEAAGDPELAQRYYFFGSAIQGRRFSDFFGQDKVSFMSEWGFQTHAEDLRRVIALVPAEERRRRVFLAGHSVGAGFAEAYAAWRFEDGTRGAEELAGLVLIDGALARQPLAETDYQRGASDGQLAYPGLDKIRRQQRYFELPLLGVEIFARTEVMALRALAHPRQVTSDSGRDPALQILLSIDPGKLPALTDAAALGLGFDNQSLPLAFARMSLGRATGGALSPYKNPFGSDMIERPSDPAATYDWVDALDATPKEWTRLADLAHATSDGRTNFAEWYYPFRFTLDAAACGGGRVPGGGYQAQAGLRCFDGDKSDAPVLAISAGLVAATEYEVTRARLAPLIGPDRPHAGARRSDTAGFRVLRAEGMTHLDPLTAFDRPENPVPLAISQFLLDHAAVGAVTVGKR